MTDNAKPGIATSWGALARLLALPCLAGALLWFLAWRLVAWLFF